MIYDKSISRTVRWSQLSTRSFIDIIGVFKSFLSFHVISLEMRLTKSDRESNKRLDMLLPVLMEVKMWTQRLLLSPIVLWSQQKYRGSRAPPCFIEPGIYGVDMNNWTAWRYHTMIMFLLRRGEFSIWGGTSINIAILAPQSY